MSKLCKDCACENVCGITHLPEDKACGFYYKADAITEIEKLKAEIEDMGWDIYKTERKVPKEYVKKERIYEILDKRIAELKGE